MAALLERETRFRGPEPASGLRARIGHEAAAGAPLEPLSPELVLVLPPELARIARQLLPEPQLQPLAASVTFPPTRRRLERVAGPAALYGFCLATTLGPLALVIATRTG